jgi:hypothetical protein
MGLIKFPCVLLNLICLGDAVCAAANSSTFRQLLQEAGVTGDAVTVSLDPARVGRDVSKTTDEVISHLNGLIGSTLNVTLEIEAEVSRGVSDIVVRM